MIREIEKLDTTIDTNFNRVDVARKIRLLSLKINEIIDVVNSMNVNEIDDDEDDELTLNDIKLKK